MTVRIRDPQAYEPSRYNVAYAESAGEVRFPISTFAKRFVGHVVGEQLLDRSDYTILELGCGQGNMLEHTVELVRAAKSPTSVRAIGVEAAGVAIDQCDERYPVFEWVAQAAERFVASDLAGSLEDAVDLVMNKGGLTFVPSLADYRRVMEAVRTMLRPGGVYASWMHVAFRDKWVAEQPWRAEVFVTEDAVFGEPQVFESSTSIARWFRCPGGAS